LLTDVSGTVIAEPSWNVGKQLPLLTA